VDDFRNLPNGDCGDGVVNPYPNDEVPDKYWSQRRRLFSLFDKGIQLDKESWYSVTPEAIANHIACHFVGSTQDAIVLDLFCGCGGNAIAFAAQKNVKLVVCVDKDLQKLKKAHWNASIYGVQDKLLLVHADAGNVLSRYCGGKIVTSPKDEDQSERQASLPEVIDAIFLSPPWGGIDYGNVGRHGYDLTCIKIAAEDGTQCDGQWLLEQATKALGQKGIAYFLPKNINGVALAKSAHTAGCRNTIVMEQNVLNGKLKTVTAYLGLGS
jgi:trimethylguanosine synthase